MRQAKTNQDKKSHKMYENERQVKAKQFNARKTTRYDNRVQEMKEKEMVEQDRKEKQRIAKDRTGYDMVG